MTRRTLHVPPFQDYCVDGVNTNADGSITAVNAAIGACGVTPPPPPNILTRAAVQYSVHGAWQIRNNVDMTSFQDIFGRLAAQDATIPWPGANGSTVRFVIPANMICSIRMDITNPINAHLFSGNSYTAGNPPLPPYVPGGHAMGVDFCLSQIQGDFSLPAPYFVHAPPESEGGFLRYWGGVLSGYYAHVSADAWYVNIRAIDPSQPAGVGVSHR